MSRMLRAALATVFAGAFLAVPTAAQAVHDVPIPCRHTFGTPGFVACEKYVENVVWR